MPTAALTHLTPSARETAEERFHRLYITSGELCKELRVTRPSILQARRRQLLPDPIAVNGTSVFIWERETLAPYVAAWRLILDTRRTYARSRTV
jgi:hypothetical protein